MNVSSVEAMPPSVLPVDDRQVLVVESDSDQRRRVVNQLQTLGYLPVVAGSGEEALALRENPRFAFALLAVRLPGISGLEVLRRLPEVCVCGAIIMVADSGHSAQIMEAFQLGADDFVRRPFSAADLESSVMEVTGRAGVHTGGRPLPKDGGRLRAELDLLISTPMREILGVIEQAARADVTVLICGETGTGKDVVARAIHAHSRRRQNAYVKVNCAAMPRELLESELFGHERGAFTGAHQRKSGRFELANGGTIFLDEIGEVHPALQAKLLHVLQDGEFSRVGGRGDLKVDVRVICATNRELPREVAAGRFREDLFYRLNVISILVPPLRERRDDIPGLARYFVERYSRLFNVPERPLSADTMQAFLAYPWPGNIRELENFVKRMIVLQDFTLHRTLGAASKAPPLPSERVGTFAETQGVSLKEISRRAVVEAEREVICRTLEQCRWNRVKTAKALKISYRALLYKMKDMGLKQESSAG